MKSRYEKSKAITMLFKRIKVLYKYVLDPTVSIFKKLLVIGALIYVFSPLDLIPEIVLGIGLVDDIVLFVFLITMISDELDRYIDDKEDDIVENKYGKVIEVDFQRVEDEEDK